MQKEKESLFEPERWRYWLLWPLALGFRLWTATLRLKLSDSAGKQLKRLPVPALILFWHNCLFIIPEARRRFLSHRDICGLISASRDGAWLSAFFRLLGIKKAVRGSSSRRGSSAMKGLLSAFKSGFDIAITPDGPRGPRYRLKPGTLWLVRKTKAPVILLSFHFSRAWRLKSWDRFYLPKPFSTVILKIQCYDCYNALADDSEEKTIALIEKHLSV